MNASGTPLRNSPNVTLTEPLPSWLMTLSVAIAKVASAGMGWTNLVRNSGGKAATML